MPDGSLVQFRKTEALANVVFATPFPPIPAFLKTRPNAITKYEESLKRIGALIETQNKLIAAVDEEIEPWKKEDLQMEWRSLNRWRCATEDKLKRHRIDISRPYDNLVAKIKKERKFGAGVNEVFLITLAAQVILGVPIMVVLGLIAYFTGASVFICCLLGEIAAVGFGLWFGINEEINHPTTRAKWLQTPPEYDPEGCYSDNCSCRVE